MIQLFDTHCHLDYIVRGEYTEGGGEDPAAVLTRAKDAGVHWLVNPSVTPARFDDVLALAERFENVYAALSVHPTDVFVCDDYPDWFERIEAGLNHPKVVAIGETGLDYYHDNAPELVARQQEAFRKLLGLAQRTGKPVIVHDRDSHDDVQRLIDEFPGARGIMHCFSGDARFACEMAERGFYISFAGNVTFKNAHALREAAAATPADRLLVETDAPFLSPMPFRGKPNEPARTRLTAECVAAVRGISLEELAELTTRNAQEVFGLC
jgi:TatD DNase family protein